MATYCTTGTAYNCTMVDFGVVLGWGGVAGSAAILRPQVTSWVSSSEVLCVGKEEVIMRGKETDDLPCVIVGRVRKYRPSGC